MHSPREVLFLPGAGDPRHPQGSSHLASYLGRELGSDFQVIAPEMPDWDDPGYQSWRDEIERQLDRLGDGVLLVGHSFGGSVLLKYLAEGTYRRRVAGMFLVSVPFWGADLPDFALPDDFAARLPDVPTFLYHSRDDSEIPLSHLRRYQEHLPRAITRVVDGDRHSFIDGLPELVSDLRATSLPG